MRSYHKGIVDANSQRLINNKIVFVVNDKFTLTSELIIAKRRLVYVIL
jgi:hypothetical protein